MNDITHPVEDGSFLFPPETARQGIERELTARLDAARRRIAAGPVTPTMEVARFRETLAGFDFEQPRPLAETLDWVLSRLEDGIVQMASPRYFGLFNPGPAFPAQCADRIAAVFNPQLATATSSPVPVAIEAHVIDALARRIGFHEDVGGHFTTGGAEANLTALVAALTRASPGFAANGVRGFAGPPRLYASADSHLAWLKIAHQCGLGRTAVRLVATDGGGRMDAGALSDAIAADRSAGMVPVMVAATAGTTNAGMIDPLAACAAAARAGGMWFHVDAAWGGAAVASPRLRPQLAGIERADSVTIDAHKWFAATMGCGMFITQDPGALSTAFQVSTSYMPSNLQHLDPYVTSVQWSRRFLGLRLFLSLAAAGWDGYARHVEHSVDGAAYLRGRLEALGWATLNASALAVLCLAPPEDAPSPREIVAAVLRSGRAWVSTATFEGRQVVRACVTNGVTTRADMDALVAALEATRGVQGPAAPATP